MPFRKYKKYNKKYKKYKKYTKYGKPYFTIGKKHFMYRTGKDIIPLPKIPIEDEDRKKKPRKYQPRYPVPYIPPPEKLPSYPWSFKEAAAFGLTLASIGKIL